MRTNIKANLPFYIKDDWWLHPYLGYYINIKGRDSWRFYPSNNTGIKLPFNNDPVYYDNYKNFMKAYEA